MSSIKTFKIFPVPVFECQIDNHEQINTKLEKYIYELKILKIVDKCGQLTRQTMSF